MGIAGPAATPELHIHVAGPGALPATRHGPGAHTHTACTHTHMRTHPHTCTRHSKVYKDTLPEWSKGWPQVPPARAAWAQIPQVS